MRFLIYIFLVVLSLQKAVGQTFTSNVSSIVSAGGYGYLGNGITVSGLGVLDGTTLGVVSIDITLTSQGSPELYLVAPDGHAVYILSGSTAFNVTNGVYTFTNDPSAPSIKYLPYTASLPGTYTPYGNLNALNAGQNASGQQQANGLWRLFGKTGGSATVAKWSINFGTTNLVPGMPNQSSTKTLPLLNTTATGNFVSGSNQYHGIVLSDSKGSEVGSSGYTETSIWYTFVPKCKNDKIEVTSANSYIQAGILTAGRAVVSSNKNIFNTTYTFPVTTFTPGNTYYLEMDGSEADVYQYQVKWFEGTSGCILPPTITTTEQVKTNYCQNSSIDVNFSITGTFNNGNVFTAQLSDTNGSFNNPIILGSMTATSPATGTVTLPSGLKTGKSYKIRVTGSNPATIGTVNSGITIIDVPATPVNISGKFSACAGEKNVLYMVDPVPGASKYSWKFSGGIQLVSANISDSSSVVVNLGNTNSNISVQAVNACGKSAALQRAITITPLSTPTININPVTTTICQGDSVKFQASYSHEGSGPVFSWKVNKTAYGGNTPAITIKNLKNKDTVSVMLTSNEGCLTSTNAFSNKYIFTVRDTIRPAVTLSGNTTICRGTPVSFLASTKNKGSNPVFNWYVNNTLQNVTDSIFSNYNFADKDSIWVTLTSNATCVRSPVITSARKKITVTDAIIPEVYISGFNQVCNGEELILQAIPQNEGSSPVYNWYINNQLQSSSNTVFIFKGFKNNDSVYVSLTSNAGCANPAKVNSPKVKITVIPNVIPSVTISGNSQVCKGSNTVLVARTLNRGKNPAFKWYLNNVDQQISDSSFTIPAPKNNDSVWVTLDSDAACASPATVSSLKTKITVIDTVKPSVTIVPNNQICKGSTPVFQANTFKSGKNPVFNWYINNVLQTGTDSIFTPQVQTKNNDSISVKLFADIACARPSNVVSPIMIITVTDTVKPSVSIAKDAFSCKGQNTVLEAKSVNGGNTASYTWFLNGADQSNNTAFFSGKNFKNGDSFVVRLQSDLPCAAPKTVFSQPVTLLIYDTVKPVITLKSDTVFCKGQPVIVTSQVQNGGNNPVYAWFERNADLNNPGKDFSAVLPVGDHILTATLTSDQKCASPVKVSASVNFTVKDSIIIKPSITGDTVICQGSSANFSLLNNISSSQASYEWLYNGTGTGNGNSTFSSSNLEEGDLITLGISNTAKCLAAVKPNVLKVKVSPSLNPDVTISSSKEKVCPDEPVVFKAQITNRALIENISWIRNGQTLNNSSDSLETSFDSPSILQFVYQATLSCGMFYKEFTAPAVAIKSPAPILTSITAPESYCAQDAAAIFTTDLISGASYSWSYPASAGSTINGNIITLNLNGNASVDTLKVKAANECGYGNEISYVLAPKNCPALFIPGAIVGSDNTGNSLWQIRGIESYPKANIMVFNRWGGKVYSSTGYASPWDGTHNGKLLPAGTYYYLIEGVQDKTFTGPLTIVH